MVAFHKMGLPSFDYDLRNSLKDFGLRLTSKPEIPTASIRKEEVYVPGKDSVVTFSDGTYEDIKISVGVRLRVLPENAQSKFEEINTWLMGAQFLDKVLTFSHYPGWLYTVRYVETFHWEYLPATGEFFTSLSFICTPMRIQYNQISQLMTNGTTYTYKGTSKPSPLVYVNTRFSVAGSQVDFITKNKTTGRTLTLSIIPPSHLISRPIRIDYTKKIVTMDNNDVTKYFTGNFPNFYSHTDTEYKAIGISPTEATTIFITDRYY